MSGPTATEKEETGSGRHNNHLSACLLTLPESERASRRAIEQASKAYFRAGALQLQEVHHLPLRVLCCAYANANAVAAMEIKY